MASTILKTSYEKKKTNLLGKYAKDKKSTTTLVQGSFSISSQMAAAGDNHGKWHHGAFVQS